MLLSLLSRAPDPATRGAAISALEQIDARRDELISVAPAPASEAVRETGESESAGRRRTDWQSVLRWGTIDYCGY